MKTTFLKIATAVLLLTAGNEAFAANPNTPVKSTVLTWINNFYKMEIHGNVQVHLLSGDKNRVEMNDSYFDHNALVQVENGVLRITCYRTERLNVWVTVNDLRALAAYDNVLIETEGKFSAIDLAVDLHNNAKADMDLDCFSTDIKLNDRSMADIGGNAVESELAVNYAATLNSTNFVADQMSSKRIAPVWETRIEYMADNLFGLSSELDQSIPATKELHFTFQSARQIKLDVPAGVDRIIISESLIN